MEFYNKNARLFVPDGASEKEALFRTTDLCICAHQDDAEIMAFCAIYDCYEKEDKWYTGITVSDGAGSPRTGKFAGYTDEQMKQVRVLEQENAARIGKYSAQLQLGYSSKQLKDTSFLAPEEELVRLIKEIRPQRIYIHNPADKHDTHVAVCIRAVNALKKLDKEYRPEKVYGMEVWRALDWLSPEDKVLFDCSGGISLAKEMLLAFESQVEGGKRYDDAACGRFFANATFFESHDTDNFTAVSYGIDLTEVVERDMDISDFILDAYKRTGEDIKMRLRRFER